MDPCGHVRCSRQGIIAAKRTGESARRRKHFDWEAVATTTSGMESNGTIRGSHPVVQKIVTAAARIATTDIGVLIVGEKGTGKELLAHYIHDSSQRAAGPFIRLDCQELAGQWNGTSVAGTLACDLDDGIERAVLQRARGGTLFLDHVSALGPELQAQVLSFLLGGSSARTDIRLVAAREPSEMLPSCLAVAGLALVEIPVPALRQRRSDIPLLVDHFVSLYTTRHGVGPRQIDRPAMVQLWQYDWPGNIRELETVIERMVVLSRQPLIGVADLPHHLCVRRPARDNGWIPDPLPPELHDL